MTSPATAHAQRVTRCVGGALALTLASACATAEPGPSRLRESDYPGLLQPPSALAHDVLWRQRVTASWGDADPRGFDAAVQKKGDTLTVLGLSALGSTGFVALLRGADIEFDNQTEEELPFPPRFILLDVQRVFFPWQGDGASPSRDGEHTRVVGGERVVDVRRGGRLIERRFTRLDGQPAGTITVRYHWDENRWTAPSRAVLDNGWFGYRLTIETLEETLLQSAPDPSG